MEKPPIPAKTPELEKQEEQEALAIKIAEGLDDAINVEQYLEYCKKYPKKLIKKAFNHVSEIPDYKIKKSRGAYFSFLIKEYAKDKEIH